MFRALLQGQLISLLIAGTGVFASILSDLDANFPMLLACLNYVLLSLFIWRKWIVRKVCSDLELTVIGDKNNIPEVFEEGKGDYLGAFDNEGEREEEGEWDGEEENHVKCTPRVSRKLLACYLGAALVDVEANFLIIQAYNYTSITSIMLLDCFTIPCAMGLSYFFLGSRYNNYHFAGVMLCLLGLICIVISDLLSEQTQYGTAPFFGDLLCLLGSGLYAVSNVTQEYLVKYHDRDEYLGFVGTCGALISFVQLMSLNYSRLKRTRFTPTIIMSISGFVTCLFFMYINTSAFLQCSDSTLFNLSLLTSDIYAVLFSYFFYGYLVHWLYFLAFALVASGLLIYHSAEPPTQIRVASVGERNRSKKGNARGIGGVDGLCGRGVGMSGRGGISGIGGRGGVGGKDGMEYDKVECQICPRSDGDDDSDQQPLSTVLPSSSSSVSLTRTLVNSQRI